VYEGESKYVFIRIDWRNQGRGNSFDAASRPAVVTGKTAVYAGADRRAQSDYIRMVRLLTPRTSPKFELESPLRFGSKLL